MIYFDGMNTGCVAAVKDADGKIRYANDVSEIGRWPKRVTVNGAWISCSTHDGTAHDIRKGNNHDDPNDNWYDADHAEFMQHINAAEAALKRMLTNAGIQTEV